MSLVRGLKYTSEGEGGDMSLVRGLKYISEGEGGREGGGYESGQATQIYI